MCSIGQSETLDSAENRSRAIVREFKNRPPHELPLRVFLVQVGFELVPTIKQNSQESQVQCHLAADHSILPPDQILEELLVGIVVEELDEWFSTELQRHSGHLEAFIPALRN
jgi:hypothetical protein